MLFPIRKAMNAAVMKLVQEQMRSEQFLSVAGSRTKQGDHQDTHKLINTSSDNHWAAQDVAPSWDKVIVLSTCTDRKWGGLVVWLPAQTSSHGRGGLWEFHGTWEARRYCR